MHAVFGKNLREIHRRGFANAETGCDRCRATTSLIFRAHGKTEIDSVGIGCIVQGPKQAQLGSPRKQYRNRVLYRNVTMSGNLQSSFSGRRDRCQYRPAPQLNRIENRTSKSRRRVFRRIVSDGANMARTRNDR